jgi:hypothetical protein
MLFRQPIGRAIVLVFVAAGTLRCAAAVRPTTLSNVTPPSLSEWWEQPVDLPAQDLFNGPWGAGRAPDPDAEYTFVRPKTGGVNPGMIVRDPSGLEWHVKQAPPPNSHRGDEGPAEVALSRVLSAVGYHQPPVYYLPSFTLRTRSTRRTEPGGRFRLNDPSMSGRGEWSWQQNPFVGQRPYQGLLAILMMFNSSDLKNSNNTLYEVRAPGRTTRWYVVRDLGNALGRTGGMSPSRNNIGLFERTQFITGVSNGFVAFDFHALHGELVRDRITPDDVAWASALMAQLSLRQWQDAFRAGGYDPAVAARYIDVLRGRIAEGQRVAGQSSGVRVSR